MGRVEVEADSLRESRAHDHVLCTKCTSHRSCPSQDLDKPANKTFGPRKSILFTPCANSRGSACVRALKYSEAEAKAAEILTMVPISAEDAPRLRTSRMRMSTSRAVTPPGPGFRTSIVDHSGRDVTLRMRCGQGGSTAGVSSRCCK